jgi:hypothetical protein
MTIKQRTKLVHAGRYVAEVDVALIEDETGWSPCLSLDDARKLDQTRNAFGDRNLPAATRLARVFELVPITT